ncbi:MAG: ABC transporter permease [Chloroflexi bacterium]|nr:ABC transporter permease [Chloroflexota bacterium]
MIPVLLGVTLVTFSLTRVLPGSPIDQIAGPMVSREQRELLMAHYGLDRPLWVQYVSYVGGVLQGDFGSSFTTSHPVARDLRAFFPATLELTTCAILLAILIGVPLGIAGAVRQGSWIDHATRVLAVSGVAMPIFWLSLVLIYVFFYQLHWLPAPIGRMSLQIPAPPEVTGLLLVDSLLAGNSAAFSSVLSQLVLPAGVLAFAAIAPLARMSRASMLDVLDSPHIRATRALGIPWRSVVWKYALKNAMLPVLTMLSIVYGFLLGGSVLVENIFAWPGLGRYAYNAISGSDYPAVQGFILYTTFIYLTIFLIVDVLYAILDPRIQE